MALVTFVFAINLIALIYLTITKVITFCRLRKARQAKLKAQEQRRNATKKALKSDLKSEELSCVAEEAEE